MGASKGFKTERSRSGNGIHVNPEGVARIAFLSRSKKVKEVYSTNLKSHKASYSNGSRNSASTDRLTLAPKTKLCGFLGPNWVTKVSPVLSNYCSLNAHKSSNL